MKVLRRVARRLSGPLRSLPDYLILGAQKAGTTSLQADLEAHPLVLPAAAKEVHYFDLNAWRGDGWYRSHFPARTSRRRVAADGRTAVTGDATPYYLFHPLAPRRARRTVPDARLVVLLRDPVARAHSHHQHERRLGFEELDFEAALDAEAERLAGEAERLVADPRATSFAHQHHSYVARGCYARQLRAWLEHFPAERLLVLTSHELAADPGATYDRVLDFLGLPAWRPTGFSRLNASGRPPLDAALRRRLERVFEPHDAELEALLGRPVDWGRSAP